MPYHIFINRESGNDNISIFYDEPTFVVIANKDDLPAIQLIEESQKPGIYILLGDNKRYVGQASNSIFSRLQQHNTNKPWWNKLIFFGREDGHLSKAQLDLLERLIIEKMNTANIEKSILKLYSAVGEITHGDYREEITKIKSERDKMYKDGVNTL